MGAIAGILELDADETERLLGVSVNYLAAIEADADRGVHFLTMEYVQGRDLETLVQEDGPLSVKLALHCAIQIARESFSVLMDEELPPDVSQHMLELACSVPGVLGAHDLRTRISGSHWFVQLHLELPGELSLSVAHGISDQAADAIHNAYPRAEVLVHADPQEVVKGAKA